MRFLCTFFDFLCTKPAFSLKTRGFLHLRGSMTKSVTPTQNIKAFSEIALTISTKHQRDYFKSWCRFSFYINKILPSKRHLPWTRRKAMKRTYHPQRGCKAYHRTTCDVKTHRQRTDIPPIWQRLDSIHSRKADSRQRPEKPKYDAKISSRRCKP